MSSYISRIYSAVHRLGLRRAAGMACARSGSTRALKTLLAQRFDFYHGTTTTGIVKLETLSIDSDRKSAGEFYVATPRYEFSSIMRCLPLERRDYVFVDLGCGMGAVLLYAIATGFRRALGVEFSSQLAQIARENASKFLKDHDGDINITVGDAAEFDIPMQPCVLFLFNPFSSAVTSAVLRNVKQVHDACHQEIYIIWYNITDNASPLFEQPWLEQHAVRDTRARHNSFLNAANFRLPFAIFKVR